ncbi:MAG TPA: amidohydrolase family protein [Gemmataceae bacterium]|nr:amidohydrolase family protein [Gemmataceae bacterium]
MPRTDRRAFLQQAASLTFGCVAGAVAAAPLESVMLPIVDTHQHLWDLSRFRLPWLKQDDVLYRSYVLSDYAEATVGLNVVKTVYMEVDVAPEQQTEEAEHVIGLCQRADSPMAAAVIGGRPASDEFPKYIGRFKDSPYIKGVRQVLHVDGTPPGYCLDAKFINGVRLLGELGKSFDLCMRAKDLPDAAKLIDACPGTRFILDHCGNADAQAKDRSQWQKDMREIARRQNVVCKVSGIVASAAPGKWKADDLAPIINLTLAVFGPDRVMFGGDWPVCTKAATYRQWVEALEEVVSERQEEDQHKLFYGNAVRFYGLTED